MFEVNKNSGEESFETRYEWLRPAELRQRQEEYPLIFFPVAPLEYHGPHMPLGVDAINASRVAHEVCARMRMGVVRPILTIGTERERDPEMVQWLGFQPEDYIVGMDFPTRQWNSHYHPEEVFATMLAAELKILVNQGYRYVLIVNGHGAYNHNQVIKQLCVRLTNTTDSKVDYHMTLPQEVLDNGWAGHADIVETSLMMYYDIDCVDLDTLPPKDKPMKYQQFSIVDGVGFTPNYDPEHIVRNDPRSADFENGLCIFEKTVDEVIKHVHKLVKTNDNTIK